MPHLILEYSDNLEFDAKAFFKELHQSLVETGAISMKGLRSRAVKRSEYLIADGYEGYKFMHLTILLREGRTPEVKQEIANVMMATLESNFGHHRDGGYIALSTDMKELEYGFALTKHNFPPEGMT